MGGNERRKKNKELFFVIVKSAVNEWNPYGLTSCAADSEFDRECRAIASKINPKDTIADIAKIVSDVFSSSFESKGFSIMECTSVAQHIKCKIPNAGKLNHNRIIGGT